MARGLPALVKVGGDANVTAIAAKYKKSPAQVSLRFLLDKGIAAIPSAHNTGTPWRSPLP
jgi:diketogulonate reductase-like aldo/keto reductase